MNLVEERYDIDFHLCIKADMGLIIKTIHKVFNLCSNYPKGNSNLFKSYIEEYYPDQLLHHVENINSNR